MIEVLSEFESESLVARLLLGKETGVLVDSPINYISVSEQDSTKISYLSTDREEKIVKDCTAAGQPSLIDRYLWGSSIRFHARPGSIITKLFKDVSAREVEVFANLYRSNVNKPRFKFNIVSGEDVRKYYNYERYAGEGRGTLGNSCMKSGSCQKFFNIYVENPDLVKMLIMLDDDGMLIGRALLWDIKSDVISDTFEKTTQKIMDRIYTIRDEDYAFYFKKWATDNGYLYKSEQNWFNTMQFENLNFKKQDILLDIKVAKFDHRYYPYFDTFKWIDFEKGTIHNYIPKGDNRMIKTLAASNGDRFDWDFMILDGINNIHRYKNECNYVKYMDLWTHQCNINYSECNNQWILQKDAYYDEELSDYLFNASFDHLNNKTVMDDRRRIFAERRERRRIEEEAQMRAIEAQREAQRIARAQRSTTLTESNIMDIINNYGITLDENGNVVMSRPNRPTVVQPQETTIESISQELDTL